MLLTLVKKKTPSNCPYLVMKQCNIVDFESDTLQEPKPLIGGGGLQNEKGIKNGFSTCTS